MKQEHSFSGGTCLRKKTRIPIEMATRYTTLEKDSLYKYTYIFCHEWGNTIPRKSHIPFLRYSNMAIKKHHFDRTIIQKWSYCRWAFFRIFAREAFQMHRGIQGLLFTAKWTKKQQLVCVRVCVRWIHEICWEKRHWCPAPRSAGFCHGFAWTLGVAIC